VCFPEEIHCEKMWNPRWQPRIGNNGKLMLIFLITTIQVSFSIILSGTTIVVHSRDVEECWGHTTKKIYLKTSQNSLHNGVAVLVM